MYSLQVAQTAQSGATGSTSVPFVNNAEMIFGSEGIDLAGGIVGSNPNASTVPSSTNPQSYSGSMAQAVPQANASGNSAVMWISVAGVLVALLIALKNK
jgi:hypothetical protein